MGQLTKLDYTDIIKKFEKKNEDFQVFIETGTYLGYTIENIRSLFTDIYSVELLPENYSFCKEKFKNESNIHLYEGDSVKLLPFIISKIDSSCIFWLDGHYSGYGTAKGSKDCPLIEEIQIIMNDYAFECLIIIDDVRLFETNINEDWSEITENKIDSLVSQRYVKKLHLNDRLIYLLKNK